MSFFSIDTGDEIILMLKSAAVEPDQIKQYILYVLLGKPFSKLFLPFKFIG